MEMVSENDALETWPFHFDQGNGDHMIDAFNSDPQVPRFNARSPI
jgi:hypothetical protein